MILERLNYYVEHFYMLHILLQGIVISLEVLRVIMGYQKSYLDPPAKKEKFAK